MGKEGQRGRGDTGDAMDSSGPGSAQPKPRRWRPCSAEASGANREAESSSLELRGGWGFQGFSSDPLPAGSGFFPKIALLAHRNPGPKSTESSGKAVPDSSTMRDPRGSLSSWGQTQELRDDKTPLDCIG